VKRRSKRRVEFGEPIIGNDIQKQELTALQRFVKGHSLEVDLMLDNPAFKFLVDTMIQNVVYYKDQLCLEKDLNEVRYFQGQIWGHLKDLELVKQIKDYRNYKEVEKELG